MKQNMKVFIPATLGIPSGLVWENFLVISSALTIAALWSPAWYCNGAAPSLTLSIFVSLITSEAISSTLISGVGAAGVGVAVGIGVAVGVGVAGFSVGVAVGVGVTGFSVGSGAFVGFGVTGFGVAVGVGVAGFSVGFGVSVGSGFSVGFAASAGTLTETPSLS